MFTQRTKPQRIEERDWTRAHCEDISNNAADSGGSAFIGLNRRRVIVRFDFEDGAVAGADDNRAGVFTASGCENLRTAAGKKPKQWLAVLIAAMLAPHGAKHAKLGVIRLAIEP